jgi:GNAT superfamily N-acetyltransferase
VSSPGRSRACGEDRGRSGHPAVGPGFPTRRRTAPGAARRRAAPVHQAGGVRLADGDQTGGQTGRYRLRRGRAGRGRGARRAVPASGVLLLGYLAVRPGWRGRGVGSAVMATLRERWLEPDSLALLELDDPRYHAPHPEHGDPLARLRFYGASGVRLLPSPTSSPGCAVTCRAVITCSSASSRRWGQRCPRRCPQDR